jgi:magnesium transporter
MDGHLVTVDGELHDVTPAEVQALVQAGTRFWLDLDGADQPGVVEMLRDVFGFHPLAVEDAEHFGQRPKIDTYDSFALFVVFGVLGAGRLVEVHCFYTETYLVTVHRHPCPDFDALVERLRTRVGPRPDHVMLLYRVIDTLVDGYFPVLAEFDDQIDELEDEILQRPTEQQLGRLFDMKRSLIALRKVVTPQRDMFASLLSGGNVIPGMTPDAERYFRDLYDHLIRISDLVDSYRDLLSGALDTHLSTVSNRLNVVMKQLTIIATVFLPMSFLTGFFGQNFGWMVNRIGSWEWFVGAGIGLQLGVVVLLFAFFRRRGWLSTDGTAPAPGGSGAVRPSVEPGARWQLLHPALPGLGRRPAPAIPEPGGPVPGAVDPADGAR